MKTTNREETNTETTPVELMSRVEEYIGILEYIEGVEELGGFVGTSIDEGIDLTKEQLICNLEWMETDGLIEAVGGRCEDVLLCEWTSTQKGKKYLETKRVTDNFKIIYKDDFDGHIDVEIGRNLELKDFEVLRENLCIADLYYGAEDEEDKDLICSIIMDYHRKSGCSQLKRQFEKFSYLVNIFEKDNDVDLRKTIVDVMKDLLRIYLKNINN